MFFHCSDLPNLLTNKPNFCFGNKSSIIAANQVLKQSCNWKLPLLLDLLLLPVPSCHKAP